MSSIKSSKYINLCDDVLIMILCELNVRQLLRLERVSQQMMDCVGSALQKKNGLSVGDIPEDMKLLDKKHALTNGQLIGGNNIAGNELNSVFEKVATKCPNITSLYLRKGWTKNWRKGLDMSLIVDNCPQLECLAVNTLEYSRELTATIGNESQKLGLTHAILGSIDNVSDSDSCGTNLAIDYSFISAGLPSLRRLSLCRFDRPLTQLFECLPQTIRALDLIECHTLTTDAVDALFSGHGIQLKEISIKCLHNTWPPFYSQVFTAICDVLTLDRLSYHCSWLTTEALKAVEKQTQLKRLSLRLSSPLPLDAVDWRLLPRLRRLGLYFTFMDASTSITYLDVMPASMKRLSIACLTNKCQCFKVVRILPDPYLLLLWG